MNSVLDAQSDFWMVLNEHSLRIHFGIFAMSEPGMPMTARDARLDPTWDKRNERTQKKAFFEAFEAHIHA